MERHEDCKQALEGKQGIKGLERMGAMEFGVWCGTRKRNGNRDK